MPKKTSTAKPLKHPKQTATPIVESLNVAKLIAELDAKAIEASLSDAQLAESIKSLPSIVKAMRLGVIPDNQSKEGALAWLNKKESEFLATPEKLSPAKT